MLKGRSLGSHPGTCAFSFEPGVFFFFFSLGGCCCFFFFFFFGERIRIVRDRLKEKRQAVDKRWYDQPRTYHTLLSFHSPPNSFFFFQSIRLHCQRSGDNDILFPLVTRSPRRGGWGRACLRQALLTCLSLQARWNHIIHTLPYFMSLSTEL